MNGKLTLLGLGLGLGLAASCSDDRTAELKAGVAAPQTQLAQPTATPVPTATWGHLGASRR